MSAVEPYYHRASNFDPWRRDTPVPSEDTHSSTPQPPSEFNPKPEPIQGFNRLSAMDWSPKDVVQWMQSLGYEYDTVQKFFKNDISGSILLELQAHDLKELDIASFGKRHRLMQSIQGLRGGTSVSSTAPSSSRGSSSRASSVSRDAPSAASTARTSTVMSSKSQQSLISNQSCSTTDDDSIVVQRPRRRRQHSSPDVRDVRKISDILPGDSVSIVAIEQLLPKPHSCSKGEDCRKWQKQQAKIARLAADLPIETWGGRAIVAGDPGNPKTAPNLLKPSPNSEVPSIVASSDALGPRVPDLSQDKLSEVQPRDPQENVRNFLNFQSLAKLQTVNDPKTPPKEHIGSPCCDSPDSAKITPTLAEKIGHLPRLQIPSIHASDFSAYTGNTSAMKTVTPSDVIKHNRLYANQRTAIRVDRNQHPNGMMLSPSDFYRMDPCYRQETPLTEVDAPVTAIPIGPITREESQSVPPNMRFGNKELEPADPIVRPASTRPEHHRRNLSNLNTTNLNTLKEGRILTPIETPEDLHRTPGGPYSRGGRLLDEYEEGVTHAGWMKKRKTTKLLRHEWEDHHFILKGTQLSMHNDEEAHRRHSRALEYIDVDDYAVACSSLASNSKLTAAFKKTILKRRESAPEDSAFAFSLIPAPNNTGGMIDRRTMFLNSGKSHHFSVKSRDQRIDWMRELMLAKALKRGRQTGATMNMNGNMF